MGMLLGLAMLDGYMYAVGGWDGSMRLDTVEQYNLYTNVWCYVSNMKMALTSPAVAAVDGCLYVTGVYQIYTGVYQMYTCVMDLYRCVSVLYMSVSKLW